MTGEDVRQVFEAILPQEAIDRLCRECGVIERQRKRHLGMLVRAMVISARPDRLAKHAQRNGDIAGQAIYAHQDRQAAATGTDHLHQRRDQDSSALGTDDAPQPQPRGDCQRHGQPHAAADQLDSQFIGLDVLQVHTTLLDHVLMHPLAVLARACQSRGYSALIDAEGGDDGLGRTAVAQQG